MVVAAGVYTIVGGALSLWMFALLVWGASHVTDWLVRREALRKAFWLFRVRQGLAHQDQVLDLTRRLDDLSHTLRSPERLRLQLHDVELEILATFERAAAQAIVGLLASVAPRLHDVAEGRDPTSASPALTDAPLQAAWTRMALLGDARAELVARAQALVEAFGMARARVDEAVARLHASKVDVDAAFARGELTVDQALVRHQSGQHAFLQEVQQLGDVWTPSQQAFFVAYRAFLAEVPSDPTPLP